MSFKKFLFALTIFTIAVPIFAGAATSQVGSQSVASSSDFSSIHNIKNIIQTKTPNFIKNPLVALIQKLENFRIDFRAKIAQKKLEVELEIKNRTDSKNEAKDILKEEVGGNDNYQDYGSGLREIFSGVTYFEVFLLSILLYILSVKLLFYGSIALVFFFILNSFWYRVY